MRLRRAGRPEPSADQQTLLGRRNMLAAGAVGAAALVVACGNSSRRSVTPPRSVTPLRPAPSEPDRAARVAGPARQVVHGPRTGQDVALTFHTAGDPAIVDAVLRAAHDTDAQLTMLFVGTWLAAHPSYAGRILAAGHDIGNHTWTHPVLADDNARQMRGEIVRCRDLLRRLTGEDGRWFRPSGTHFASPLMLREAGAAGYPEVLAYDVDPLDYTDPGPAAVKQRVLAAAHPGAIVSLHTLYEGTAQALPEIVHGLRRSGLRVVSASQLMADHE